MNPSPDRFSSQPPKAGSMRQRSWILRFFRCLRTPRGLGRLLGVALILATLLVGFYVEEKVRGRWAWNRYRHALEQQGLSVDVKTIQPPPLPPEANFARSPALQPTYDLVSKQKRPLARAPDQLQARLDGPRLRASELGYGDAPRMVADWQKPVWPDPYEMLGKTKRAAQVNPPASPEEAAELVLDIYRKSTGPLLDELQVEAGKRRYSNFDINYDVDEPFNLLLPYLAHFKSLGVQSTARACAELYLKQSEAALGDVLFCLHLSETMKDDPVLIAFLVSVALREISIDAAWYGLASRQWNVSQLEQLQARLEAVDMVAWARQALNAERVLGQRAIEGLARQFPHEASFEALGEWFGGEAASVADQVLGRSLAYLYPKGWFYFESIHHQRLFLSCFVKFTPPGQARLDLKALGAAQARAEEEFQGTPIVRVLRRRYLSSTMLPALGKVLHRAARNQAANSMAATACALERFRIDRGQYPPQLSDLTPRYLKQVPMDHLSGEPLRYQVDAGGAYRIYSVGVNGVDDGGKVVFHSPGRINQDEGDWVWQYPPP